MLAFTPVKHYKKKTYIQQVINKTKIRLKKIKL